MNEQSVDENPDVVVLREGTEGLSMKDYAAELRDRLPEYTVVHARTPREERTAVESARIVTGVSISSDLLDRATELELFACIFAGTDHLPVRELSERDIVVTNASGIHAPGIAEQVLGSILTFARRLHHARDLQSDRTWNHYHAGELQGSTVTVVGMGSIGTAVVERLDGFGVKTIAVRHSPEKSTPTDSVVGYDQLHDALAETDYLVLACPLTDTTRGLVGSAEFATLDPNSVIVNVSRGPVVDSDALVAALRTDTIGGAALDVTDPEPLPSDHPLWGLEDCLITPHVGGSTPEHWPRMADLLAQNVRALVEGSGSLKNRV